MEHYKVNRTDAGICAFNFLKEFRKCPDNLSQSLDQYRCELWETALPAQHKNLAYEIYKQWIYWRYVFLQIPTELVQMLKNLRKNYLLAIITNGPSNAQWEKIQKLQLNMPKNRFFDCILVSGDFKPDCEKPDSKIFLAACNYLNVAPRNVMMVGDKLETDIQVMLKYTLINVLIFIHSFTQYYRSLIQPYIINIIISKLKFNNFSFKLVTIFLPLLDEFNCFPFANFDYFNYKYISAFS